MLIKTKCTMVSDPMYCDNVLEIDIPDEEILALGKQYFKLAAEEIGDISGDTTAVISENQMPSEESHRKIFDDVLKKYNIDEVTRNLGVILNDHDMAYYGKHTSEWFWMWYFIKDIYNSAVKENKQ